MGYYDDFSGQWREHAEDRAEDAANAAMIRVTLGPLAVAVLAILVAGAGLAVTYVSALLSLFFLEGIRWWVAATLLVTGHMWAVPRAKRLGRAVWANRRTTHPVPSLRETLSVLNSRRAWLTRLAFAVGAVLAAATLRATGLPAILTWGIPLVAVFSLDILFAGTRPFHPLINWVLHDRDPR